jgi:Domain of unknown function (DUF3329).
LKNERRHLAFYRRYFFSLLAGLASGQIVICLLAGIVLFMIWQYRVLKQLYEWLQYRNESDRLNIRVSLMKSAGRSNISGYVTNNAKKNFPDF